MSLPSKMYKFGTTSFLDVMTRFRESAHNTFTWDSIPLSRDYNVTPLWSTWVVKEEAFKAEQWFRKTYPKNFYCDIPYNGIGECRVWTLHKSNTFQNLLNKKYIKDFAYQKKASKILSEKAYREKHMKLYYVLLIKKNPIIQTVQYDTAEN